VIGAEIVSSRASLDVPDHQFLFVSLPAAVQRRQASRKQTITEAAGGPPEHPSDRALSKECSRQQWLKHSDVCRFRHALPK
jgi:hypothetical protein